MSYASTSHVSALDRGRDTFTAGSKPNTNEVTRFLEQTAGEIDAILRTRDIAFPLPTSATSALALLEMYNSFGADCLVQRAAVNSSRRKEACAAWEAAKKFLLEEDLGLPTDPLQFGAPSITGGRETPIFSLASGYNPPGGCVA